MQALYQLSYNPEGRAKYRRTNLTCQGWVIKKVKFFYDPMFLCLFDRNGFDNHVFVRGVAAVGLDASDFVENFETFVKLTEYRVAVSGAGANLVVVQEMHVVAVNNKELAADGVRHSGLCPAQSATHVGETRVILVANRGAGALGRVATRAVSTGKVTALDHEVLDNAVERSAVILALLGEFNEVCGAFANDIFENAQLHGAVVCLHDGDGFACFRFTQLIEHKISY